MSGAYSVPEIVTLLGGGWSAKALDLNRLPGLVIGVNDAAVLAKCDVAVSMDRLWTEGRWGNLTRIGKPAYIRDAALKNIKEKPDWLRPFLCDYKSIRFADHPDWLNGTNSGGCALNLAYRYHPKRLYLVGFDMNRSPAGEAYWWKPYPWAPGGATKPGKYNEWSRQFWIAAAAFKKEGIEVLNVSPTSAIDAFRKISFEDFRKDHP